MKIKRYIRDTHIEPEATLYGGDKVENYITQVYATVEIIEEYEDDRGDESVQYSMAFDLQDPQHKTLGNYVDSEEFVIPEEVMENIEAWWNAEETINRVKNMWKEQYRPGLQPSFPEPTEEEITL
jgi:hypothetical protein